MKKLALILGAVGATLLLAGGVVAAYVINDNADKSGITITPGSITEDKTGTVTLSWGEMAAFTNIEGLSAANPVTRSVNIKAELKDENGTDKEEAYQGKLDVELKDLSGKKDDAVKLVDYLSISVQGYAFNTQTKEFAAEKSELGAINPNGQASISVPIYADKAGKQVDFVVSLDVAATPVMSQINADSVYLTVDWNRGEAAQGVKHVFIPDNGWEDMYVYSYSADKENASWPGVKLERDPETGLFVADLLAHDYFIFNNGAGIQYPESGEGMTASDLAYNVANRIYFNWSTHTFVAEAPQTLAPFYLLGETTVWDIRAEYAFEAKDEDLPEGIIHQWYLKADLEKDLEFKVRSGDGNVWLGYNNIEDASKALVAGQDNFTFVEDGSYEFYVKQGSDQGYSVYIAKEGGQQPAPQPQVAPYYLLGHGGSWELADGFAFALSNENKLDDTENQWYAQVTVTAETAYKIRSGENENAWYGLDLVQQECADLVEANGEGGNFQFKVAGTYDIYLKELVNNGGFRIWIAQAQ
jgi:hypothetical protein